VAGDVGTDTAKAAEAAVGGVLDAAGDVGGDALDKVRAALLGTAKLPHDVVEAAIKGHRTSK